MGKKIKLKQTAGKVYVSNPNDPRLKSYTDSLYSYNIGKRLEGVASGIPDLLKVAPGSVYDKKLQEFAANNKGKGLVDNSGNDITDPRIKQLMKWYQANANKSIQPVRYQGYYPDPSNTATDLISLRGVRNMMGLSKPRSRGYNLPEWKKPEQEVVYDPGKVPKEVKKKPDKSVTPKPVKPNKPVRQETPVQTTQEIPHTEQTPTPPSPIALPQGEPVYGPGNSLIGTYNYSNGNGTFTSVHDYNKYATTAADRTLLNNPEQLQAYMKQKTKGAPTTFKQSGGKIQFKQYGGKLNTSESIVDQLKAIGSDSSYTARKKMYESTYGQGYTGSSDQNINLLKLLHGKPGTYGSLIVTRNESKPSGAAVTHDTSQPDIQSQQPSGPSTKYVKAAPVKNTFTLSSSQPPGVSAPPDSVKKSVVNDPSTSNSVIKKPYKYVRAPAPDFGPKAPQSGVVLDKRSGRGYITKDGTAVKQFPILTGANVEGNMVFGNTAANAPMEGRATPVGYYIMKGKPTDAAAYNNEVTKFTPIPAYGLNKPDVRAGTLGIHSTWDPANRDILYNTAHPWASYGCVNCHPNDWRNIDRTFPQGDTAVVVDPKMPWGNKILNDIHAPALTNTTANKQSGGPMHYCRECGSTVPSLSTFAHRGKLAQNNFTDDDYQQRQQSLHKLYPDMDNYPYNPNVIAPANQVSLDNIPQQSGDMYHQYEQNRQALTDLHPGIQFPDYDYSALQHDKFKEATAKPGNNHDWIDYLHTGEDAIQYIGGLFNEGHNYRNEARQRRRGLETIEQDVQDKDRYGLNPASFLEQYGGDIPQFGSGGLTSAKAKLMLREGKANGKKLTGKQKRYFGLIAGGGHPRKQNAGEVPEIDGAPDTDPEVWAETGEVVRMRDGTISRIAANGARTFDHGERKGIPGTPINGAESFLEATSTKKGRSAMADKLLKVDRDTAEQISGGYRPAVPLSHATLYTQAAEHHGKMKLKMEKRLKLQLERGINNEANRNSIKMNMDFIGGIPSENDLYESIFQHQEATKEQNDIPDEPTAEQKAQYPNKMQLGGMAQNAKRKQTISKFKQEHPPLFSSFDDVVDFYKNNYGYPGAKGDIAAWQNWMTKTPATRTTLINYLRTAPLTAKGIKSYGDVDPKALSDEQLVDQFKDGRFDFRAPMVMNYQSPEAVPPPGNVPPGKPITPPVYVPHIPIDPPKFHTTTKASGKPPYFPLQYEDIAASRMAYLAAQNRDPETMIDTYMPRVQYKTKDPTQGLREIDYDAQAAMANLPMGTQGAGIRSQIQAGRDKSKMGLSSQYDNDNVGILNRQEDVNADYTAKENQLRTQNLGSFIDHYLQSRAVAGEQKLQAADSYYKTVAKNKMFNRMTQMMKPRNYALNEDGSFSYSGSWDVNNPAMGYDDSTYDTSGTKSSNRVQIKTIKGITYQWDPSTGRWVVSSLPPGTKRWGGNY